VLLLPRFASPNLRRIANPHFVPQLRQQLQKPLTISSSLHADPRARRKLPIKVLRSSRFMHQLPIPGLARLLVKPRNLLPTRVKITSNKNHRLLSVPLSFGPQPKANTVRARSLLAYPINSCTFCKGGAFS